MSIITAVAVGTLTSCADPGIFPVENNGEIGPGAPILLRSATGVGCAWESRQTQSLTAPGAGGGGSLAIPGRRPGLDAPTEAEDQWLAAARQMREFRLSMALSMSQLLSGPVLDDPEASTWQVINESSRIEGAVLARGVDWALLKMVAVGERDGQVSSFDAFIDTAPAHTLYDFGSMSFDVRDDVLILDDYIKGCDPETGVRFSSMTVTKSDGSRTIQECWPMPALPADQQDPRAIAEFQASWDLQCAQTIERALLF